MDHLDEKACKSAGMAVRDTLGTISGKWKLHLLLTLYKGGKRRFRELVKEINISPRVLSKELRELEMNKLVSRTVCDTRPVTVAYEITPYCQTLGTVIIAMKEWGEQHRVKILKKKAA